MGVERGDRAQEVEPPFPFHQEMSVACGEEEL